MSKTLVKSTSTIVGMSMISRIFGCLRDMVMAQLFGATAAWDAFSVAFKIPNIVRQLFSEGSFSQAFVPILAEYQEKNSRQEVKSFLNAMAGVFGLILFFITVLGVWFAPEIIHTVAPGFTKGSSRFDWAVIILRITFPYFFLIALTGFAGAILNTYSRFWVAAFTPLILNVVMILAALFFSPYLPIPIIALAWGVVFAGVLQLLFQWYFLKPLKVFSWPSFQFNNPAVKRVLKLMLPALLGVSIVQINLLLDTVFASFLKEGSVSWLYFSDRIMDIPVSVFSVAISTVILPHLSRSYANQSRADFSLILDWALRCVLLVGFPATVMLAVISGPLLSTFFQHGQFDGYAVIMARKSLAAFAIAIIPVMLIKVLVAGFYAKQNMRTPVRIAMFAVLANIIFNLILILPLAHAGIALSTSLAALFNVILLYYFLRRYEIYQPMAGWRSFIFRLLFACIVLTGWLWFASGELVTWVTHRWMWRFVHLGLLLASAMLVYFAALRISGVRVSVVLGLKNNLLKDDSSSQPVSI